MREFPIEPTRPRRDHGLLGSQPTAVSRALPAIDYRWETALLVLGWAVVVLLAAGQANAVTLGLDTQPGWNIYAGGGYRYGPSIIINPENSIDVWTSAPPANSIGWDSIRHMRSTDGGVTWGAETVALQPTPGSYDAYSTCDPGVVYFGGYYYIGYTSTQNAGGVDNEVCVARSTSPNSGFQKWNGAGWGGNPQPFIQFTGTSDQWGAGEPSFVVKDDTLYIYYSWVEGARTTRVATASVNDANWPAHLTYHGTAANNGLDDSIDVKYVDAYGKFIGVSVGDRFSSNSYLHVWESQDGLTFTSSAEVRANTQDWAHNAGISGTPNGHLDINDNNVVAYAYCPNDAMTWANWPTYLNPVTITCAPEPSVLGMLCGAAAASIAAAMLGRRRNKNGETTE